MNAARLEKSDRLKRVLRVLSDRHLQQSVSYEIKVRLLSVGVRGRNGFINWKGNARSLPEKGPGRKKGMFLAIREYKYLLIRGHLQGICWAGVYLNRLTVTQEQNAQEFPGSSSLDAAEY